MEIVTQSVILRDMVLSDIEDDIRWKTIETRWQDWDEPWEYGAESESFDKVVYRKSAFEEFQQLEKMKEANDFRLSLEIDTLEGIHIGTIDSYRLSQEVQQELQSFANHEDTTGYAIGIAIYEPEYWNQGLGRSALEAYRDYHLENQHWVLYLETWSGNARMIAVANKLGFKEIYRAKNRMTAFGKQWDKIVFEYRDETSIV